MKFKVVNSIPRIIFSYKSRSTNGQLTFKHFFFPSRPATIIRFFRELLFGDRNVYSDELGILVSHDDIYNENDVILAVGVGNGISLVHNCLKKRIDKSFIGVDGSQEQIEIAKSNARLNGVYSSKYELLEGYVGNPTNIYGELNQQSKKKIDINKIKFDVLELDCEGSELEILRDLTVLPRHIIVEMHPMYRDINVNEFLEEMSGKGYKLVKLLTVNGESVIISDIDKYFRIEFIEKIKKNEISTGDGLLVFNFTLQ